MTRSPHSVAFGRSRGSLVAALAAGAGLAVVAEGLGGAARAGVPVDAVLAVTAEANRSVAAPSRIAAPAPPAAAPAPRPARPAETGIPEGANVALPTASFVAQADASGGGGAPEMRLQFLVKFEDAEAAEWRDRFKESPREARAAWDAYARQNAAFADLRLAQPPDFSGVATLELTAPTPTAPAAMQRLSDDIVGRLNAADGVEYAEPNLVATKEGAQ